MLTLVEPFALGAMEHLGPDAVHLLVQAKQLAFHDRDHFLADPTSPTCRSTRSCPRATWMRAAASSTRPAP